MKNIIYIYFILSISLTYSQHGVSNIWLMGIEGTAGSGNAPMQLNFYTDTVDYSVVSRSIQLNRTASTISDKQGNLLFYTNGIVMGNRLNDTMQNSQGFNPGYLTNSQSDGLNMQQNCLIIPFPADTNKYYVFHESMEIIMWGSYYYPLHLSYSVVDMALDNSLGAVTDKNMTIINDTLEEGLLSAVKHANGRDWWIIVPVPSADFIYTLLVTPNGIQGPFQQRTNGMVWGYKGFSGQTVISPDGSKYARYDREKYLNIFDFNRCDGTFSNLVHIYPGGDANEVAGLSFSANSRFLYVSRDSFLIQYDLLASNIANSKVIIFDGATTAPISEFLLLANLALDGKIYITGGNSHYLHIIHSPDSVGLGCNFEYMGLPLTYLNQTSLPYHPNYALGPLIGSKCDTLTSISKPMQTQVEVYPNPTTDKLHISLAGIKEPLTVLLLNTLGQEVARYALAQEEQEISLANLPKGVYYCRVLGREGVYFAAKVIKE